MSDAKNPYRHFESTDTGKLMAKAGDEGAAAERVRIVAWLRAEAASLELPALAAWAERIEAGAHRDAEEKT